MTFPYRIVFLQNILNLYIFNLLYFKEVSLFLFYLFICLICAAIYCVLNGFNINAIGL